MIPTDLSDSELALGARLSKLEAENARLADELSRESSLRAAVVASASEIRKEEMVAKHMRRGAIVPAMIPLLQAAAQVLDEEKLAVALNGLPVVLRRVDDIPARVGTAAENASALAASGSISREDAEQLRSVGLSVENYARLGSVKGLTVDGRAVLDDGRIVPLAEASRV